MTDKFDQRIQIVRLAQQVAQLVADSKVPRDEWSMVLQFVKVLLDKGSPAGENAQAEAFPLSRDKP